MSSGRVRIAQTQSKQAQESFSQQENAYKKKKSTLDLVKNIFQTIGGLLLSFAMPVIPEVMLAQSVNNIYNTVTTIQGLTELLPKEPKPDATVGLEQGTGVKYRDALQQQEIDAQPDELKAAKEAEIDAENDLETQQRKDAAGDGKIDTAGAPRTIMLRGGTGFVNSLTRDSMPESLRHHFDNNRRLTGLG